MKWKLRAYGPASADCCFAVVQIDSKLAAEILGRMSLFESLKARDPGLKAIKYWPDGARWFAGLADKEVEILGEDAPPGRAMRIDHADMTVTDAAVWWSCLLHGTDRRLVTTGFTREDLLPLVEAQDSPCAPAP